MRLPLNRLRWFSLSKGTVLVHHGIRRESLLYVFKYSGGHLLVMLKWVEINESRVFFLSPVRRVDEVCFRSSGMGPLTFIVACRRKKLSHVDYPGMSLIRNALRALLKKCILSFFCCCCWITVSLRVSSTFIQRTSLARTDRFPPDTFLHCP